ncbi:membrane hypothetical protein [Gammaproteobacteria bacterium]
MKAILVIVLVMVIQSCTSTKKFSQVTDTASEVRIETLQDSLSVIKQEKEHLENLIREMEFTSVIFDSTRCPEIPRLPEGIAMLNKDSVQELIDKYNYIINGLSNKIVIASDGSITASGRIKQLQRTTDKLLQTIADKDKRYDSLLKTKQEVKQENKHEQTKIASSKKVTFLNFWWLLVIGTIIGFIIRSYLPNIFSSIKQTIMKNKISIFVLMLITLASCGHYSDGQSVWTADGEPMWILPLLTFLPACFFTYRSIYKSKLGSEKQLPEGGYKDLKKNIPFYKQNLFMYAAALFVATIVIIIAINRDK